VEDLKTYLKHSREDVAELQCKLDKHDWYNS
jgi:hypothetical protein